MKKQKRTTVESKKFNLPELVWLGFNYTCGIAFTSVYATMMFSEADQTGQFLGMNMIWIFLVGGLVAGTCAWAFNKLSQVHPAGNGASYIYVRTNFGKFWGWLISFLQYTTLPIIVTSQIVSMVRLNFVGSGTFLDTKGLLGNWANLIWDGIGIVVYMLVSCSLFLGMRLLKRYLNASSYIKWGSTVLLIIALITLFAINGTSAWDVNASSKYTTLTSTNFSIAFTSCFFFFLGFETYATIGKNVRNPERNIGRSIIWTMTLAIIFYVLITILMLGAIAGSFTNNPNLQIFRLLGKHVGQWVYYVGVIIMLICTISLKANAGMQNALYSGAILEPFAIEGLMPSKYQELNKDGIPFKASFLNLIITFIFAMIWLFIPDIIQGATGGNAVFSYAAITGEASLIMIIIYSFVIMVALKLGFTKKMRVKVWEMIAWSLALIFLIWQFVQFFVDLGRSYDSAISDLNTDASKSIATIVSNTLQVVYIIGMITFAIIWYYTYYWKKYQARLKTDPQLQKALDASFVVTDDWKYVVKEIQIELDRYLVRNQKIYDYKDNPNQQDAKHIRQEAYQAEDDLQEPD
ncbi:APC family permease [Spiroplasma endosymbiont of Stenodema calcarata]|uniref:APC family permease n=1 Tax=Spiroplasma endosymbiont of Stenodema calcarata TaxID=3139328 RepID=UPI003CCB2C34